MASIIKHIDKNSPCYKKVRTGDKLVAVNSHIIHDVLDYMYYCAQSDIKLTIERGGICFDIDIKKDEYEDLGLDFENYLMDKEQHCSNKCIFCFIDQLPRNMRKTLYFKDDDARMSFLLGNYATLTNLSDEDIDRIIQLKISPINISVHATDPEVRVKMMANPKAARCYEIMKKFAQNKIEMKGQIVLCPDVNDGEILKKSIHDLLALYPYLTSLSVVPVGLTKHREGLYPLRMVTQSEANEIIDIIETAAQKSLVQNGSRVIYAADELYLKAGREIPPAENYEDYPQIENGVGMIASMKEEFDSYYKFVKSSSKRRAVTVVTGVAAYPFISLLVAKLIKKWHNLDCRVYKIPNLFFGENITVAGLVTGQDIIRVLKDEKIADELLIPAQMLRYDKDRFLDDVLVTDLEKELNCKVKIVENDGAAFIEAVLGETL